MITLYLRGLLIGLAIAVPVGPIGVLCIRRTLAQGRLTGFLSGLGAATADALYGSIAGFGLVFLSNFLVEQQIWLRIVGGVFLLYLGMRTFLAKSATKAVRPEAKSFFKAYLSTLLLTLTNPLTILSFAAIFAGVGMTSRQGEYRDAILLVLGVFSGSATWWLTLSSLASLLGERLGGQGLTWVNRISGLIIVAFGITALLAGLNQKGTIRSTVISSSVSPVAEGFSHADGTLTLEFPRDHGAHPDYQTEWWYFTGNLVTADNRRFGYQLTFFRRALEPPNQWIDRPSQWATTQAYLAHFALTDVSANKHLSFEQLERGAAGLAGASPDPFQVWLDDWRVEETSTDHYHLVAQALAADSTMPQVAVDLELIDARGPVFQGNQGYSQKGVQPGNASYYYSLTRLISKGTVQSGGDVFKVTGSSWMDHEFSTSALSADQVGWDWFSIQLDNDTELMVFQIRKADGSVDPFSSGLWIEANSATKVLKREDFQIKVSDTWHSPKTNAVYPSGWLLNVPTIGLEVKIQPFVADQELDLTYKYWEGAVLVKGVYNRKEINGTGYVELTGYAGSMAGEF